VVVVGEPGSGKYFPLIFHYETFQMFKVRRNL
jgi:hypothetical protein